MDVVTTPSLGPSATPRALHVGCSGWYYWHWKGTFYPDDLPSSQHFRHYTTHFNTVELNAPFYAWPTVKTIQTWLRQAAHAPDFVYTIKVCELITHIKRFTGTKTLVKDFSHIADLLGAQFGSFLYQLPPSHTYTPARLRAIASQLYPLRHLTNVLEFRHKSWWNETVYRTLRDANLTFCSSSGPNMPDELIQTTPTLYLRFHGTKQWYRHNYTPDELRVWADRVAATDAQTVYAYFNNDRDVHAISNAKTLLDLLRTPRASPIGSTPGVAVAADVSPATRGKKPSIRRSDNTPSRKREGARRSAPD